MRRLLFGIQMTYKRHRDILSSGYQHIRSLPKMIQEMTDKVSNDIGEIFVKNKKNTEMYQKVIKIEDEDTFEAAMSNVFSSSRLRSLKKNDPNLNNVGMIFTRTLLMNNSEKEQKVLDNISQLESDMVDVLVAKLIFFGGNEHNVDLLLMIISQLDHERTEKLCGYMKKISNEQLVDYLKNIQESMMMGDNHNVLESQYKKISEI